LRRPSSKSFILLAVTTVIYSSLYLSVNWYSFYYQSQNFLYWPWELEIPLVDWFILIYFSAYLSFLPVFFGLNYQGHLKIAKALIVSGFIGCMIFLVYPTSCAYQRDLNEVENFKLFYSFLWTQDNPTTLMPSFHVAMSAIFLLPMAKHSRSYGMKIFYGCWLALICVSIVLVHQHHIIDIFTGLILSYFSLKIVERIKNHG